MSCSGMDRLLFEYLAGDLAGEKLTQIEVHLASCADCALRCDELNRTLAIVRDIPVEQPDAITWTRFEHGLTRRIRGARPSARRSVFSSLRWTLPALAATALLLALSLPQLLRSDQAETDALITLDRELVLALEPQIEQLLLNDIESFPADDVIWTAVDWIGDAEIAAVADAASFQFSLDAVLDEEQWSQEDAKMFIELFTEQV